MFNKLRRALRWVKAPQMITQEILDRGLDTTSIWLPGYGETVITGNSDLIKQVVNNRSCVGGLGMKAMKNVLGENALICAEGDIHKRHRSQLMVFFNGPRLQENEEAFKQIIDKHLNSQVGKEPFNAFTLFKSITLENIIYLTFGEMDASERDQLMELCLVFTDSFRNPLRLILKLTHWDLGELTAWGRYKKCHAQGRAFVRRKIDDIRVQNQPDSSMLNQLVLDDSENALSGDEIVDEVISTLLIGSDTIAASLAWLMSELSQRQDILDALHAEMSAGNSTKENALFLRVITENLRLNPVAPHLTRVCKHATVVGDYAMKEGGCIMPSALLAHRSNANYASPNEFNPDRYLEFQPERYQYFPFGFGTRRCLGGNLAERELQLVLAALLNYDMEFEQSRPSEPKRHAIILIPCDGPMMRLKKAKAI